MVSRQATGAVSPVGLIIPPAAVLALLWATRVNEVSKETALLTLVLLFLPWSSFVNWKQENRGGLPVFPMVGAMYWIYFGLGAFWGERILGFGHGSLISEDSVTEVLRMAALGVTCMWAGMRVPLPLPAPSRQPALIDSPRTWTYVRLLLLGGTLAGLAPGAVTLLGSGGRQIMEIAILTVPTVALMLLFRRFLEGNAPWFDRLLLLAYLPARVLAGLSSGWLGSVAGLGLICAAMYIKVRKRVPWAVIALSVAAVLFLQPGKKTFRDRYWAGAEGGIFEKATYWVSVSGTKWSEAFEGKGEDTPSELAMLSLERTSLLNQVVNVLDLTPRMVPFQGGATYKYLAVTLVPRFLWPNKPSVSEANRYYQAVFGRSSARDLATTSISVGCLAEAYINFGWLGVAGIMFGIGMVLGVYEKTFLSRDSNALFVACGLALLPGFIGIEAQAAQYIGGVVQYVILTFVIFFPVTRRPKSYILPVNNFLPARSPAGLQGTTLPVR